MLDKLGVNKKDALIVVDVQNDFCPGGALAVNEGDQIIPIVNEMAKQFDTVIITQDWHPKGHISFASTHGADPFSAKTVDYGTQVMWPDHCVQASDGAALHADLDIPHAKNVIRKGLNPNVDSYSAFIEADGSTTGLAGYLHDLGIERVVVVGLATDFCVAWTAMDARKKGFEAVVVADACRGIDIDGSLNAAWVSMADVGVERFDLAPQPTLGA
jgi:nicotinamidase/pyrazinamidase